MNERVTYLEEDTGTGEDHCGGRESLSDRYQCEIDSRSVDIHHTNTWAKCLRKCKQDVDRGTKPLLQSLVAAPALVELIDLVMEYG